MPEATACLHPDFRALVKVARLEDAIAGRVEGTGYLAEVSVTCAACGIAFRFVGVPAGIDYARPTTAIDGCTLHAPIEPATSPTLASRATYRVPGAIRPH